MLSTRKVDTGSIRVKNNDTLILTGVLQDTDVEKLFKTPLLGDLPILGALFRSSAKSVQERNLMIFLRPTILRDSITTKDLSEEKFNLIRAKQLLNEEPSD
mgnify:CR=1 FL=1